MNSGKDRYVQLKDAKDSKVTKNDLNEGERQELEHGTIVRRQSVVVPLFQSPSLAAL